MCPRRRSSLGHTVHSRKQIKFDALTCGIAELPCAPMAPCSTGDRKLALRFQTGGRQPGEAAGNVAGDEGLGQRRLRVTRKTVSKLKDLKAALGENQLAGSLLLTDGAKHIEAQLSSPRLDLTPFFPQDKPGRINGRRDCATAPQKQNRSSRRRSSCSARRRCHSTR